MAIAEIHSWLQSERAYADGVSLFLKFSSNDFLKKLFVKSQSAFNRDLLKKELEKLSGETASPVQVRKTGDKIRADYYKYPEEIRALIDRKNILHKEMSHLHSRLRSMHQPKRQEAAARIVSIDKELIAIWKQVDAYIASGRLPEKETPTTCKTSPQTLLETIRRRDNLRSYITKGEKKNDSRVPEWIAEKTSLDKRIKAWD
jgi:hypothetical protein